MSWSGPKGAIGPEGASACPEENDRERKHREKLVEKIRRNTEEYKKSPSYPGPTGCSGPLPVQSGRKLSQALPVVPNACPYPLAIGIPLDCATMLPLQQPLFDSEWFIPGKGIKDLPFFKNPIGYEGAHWSNGGKFEHLDEIKTKHDTNLNQPSVLDYPIEFSILGFNAFVDSKTSDRDRDALLSSGALFTFLFSGNRPCLSIPFEHILKKSHQKESVCHALADYWTKIESAKPESNITHPRKDESKEREPKDDLIDHAVKLLEKCVGDQFYKFNLGKSALKIKPGEAFRAALSWKKTPLLSKPVKIYVEIVGLRWTPM